MVGGGSMEAAGAVGNKDPIACLLWLIQWSHSPLICKREWLCDPGAGVGLGKSLKGLRGLFAA